MKTGIFVTLLIVHTKYPTPKVKRGKGLFSTQFVEVAVWKCLAPRQGGSWYKDNRQFMVVEDSKSSAREQDKPLSVPDSVSGLLGLGWYQSSQWTDETVTHL